MWRSLINDFIKGGCALSETEILRFVHFPWDLKKLLWLMSFNKSLRMSNYEYMITLRMVKGIVQSRWVLLRMISLHKGVEMIKFSYLMRSYAKPHSIPFGVSNYLAELADSRIYSLSTLFNFFIRIGNTPPTSEPPTSSSLLTLLLMKKSAADIIEVISCLK